MFNKILVPLDGSELSESVLNHVVGVAKGCREPEIVLTRVHYSLDKDVVESLDAKIAADLQAAYHDDIVQYLDKVAADLRKKGLLVSTVVLHGNPAEEILKYTHDKNVDLIIMSTHGRSGVSRLFFGSVADKVIRNSEIPVLVKPPALED